VKPVNDKDERELTEEEIIAAVQAIDDEILESVQHCHRREYPQLPRRGNTLFDRMMALINEPK
jgi:hypothetical protein